MAQVYIRKERKRVSDGEETKTEIERQRVREEGGGESKSGARSNCSVSW